MKTIPVENPRINEVFEKRLRDCIKRLAKRDGVSISLKLRDLIKEALEIEEDIALTSFAEEREKTFSKKNALKHNEVW